MSSVAATARPPALNEDAGPSTSRLPRQTGIGAYPSETVHIDPIKVLLRGTFSKYASEAVFMTGQF